jgi:hypothetical protein
MANITPASPVAFSDVYQLETTDLVLGGAGQTANRQAQSLVNRTQYLKDKLDNDYAPKAISANTTLPISDLTNYEVTGSGLSISINDYTQVGFKIRVLVDYDTSVTYTDATETSVTVTFLAGTVTELTWNGTYWEHTNPITISSSQTLNPKFPMSVAIDTASVVLTLGDGAYVGYELPVLAKAVCSVSYTGEGGATTDELNPSDYITYVWQGTYWIVDASTYDKPVVISTTQSIAPTKKMSIIIDTDDVQLTLLSGLYATFELPILAQANCTVRRLTSDGWVTDTLSPSDYAVYVWDGTYWLPQVPTPITGIDDNGQPFAFNIDSMVHHQGLINLTGTDANGNPFDYGLGRLVTNADEDNLVTGVEVKTSKTFNGKPVYNNVITGNLPSTITEPANLVVQIPLANVDLVLSATGSQTYGSTNRRQLIPFVLFASSTGLVYQQFVVNYDADKINYLVRFATSGGSADFQGKPFYIKLEYTKTTD